MKILLIAYACDPQKGSEPQVGWKWLSEIARHNNVWALIYAGQGQQESVSITVNNLAFSKNIVVYYVQVPKFTENEMFFRLRYYFWLRNAFRKAKEIESNLKFDIIHLVSISAWWFNAPFWKLTPKFIWGPILGGQRFPSSGLVFLQMKSRAYEILRNISLVILPYLLLSTRKAIKRSDLLIVGNKETGLLVKKIEKNVKTLELIAPGISTLPREKMRMHNSNKIIFLYSGLLIARKNFGFLLDVFKRLPYNMDWSLNVLGEGNMLNYWEKKAEDAGFEKRINFYGHINYNNMTAYYSDADIFLFPSLREGSPAVIIEAMANSLPVIAFRMNGADIMLNDKTGFLIDIFNRTQMINDYANAIIKLYENPVLRLEMSNNARKKAEGNFLWEKRGEEMNKIYQQVLDS